MGADATIRFSGIGSAQAQATATAAAAEIERLEGALSLFREDSEISRLNRTGALDEPSGDLRRALALALAVAEATGGLFDPTVQALWRAYVDWFASTDRNSVPPDAIVETARQRVDWRHIEITSGRIILGDGQAITLNGLGQGYVTDRVADLFLRRGIERVLIDLGEQRALGPCADGASWRIARTGGRALMLRRGALATSEGAGCKFDTSGAAHHLFDPRSGRSATIWRRITVHHGFAAVADALSTALYAATAEEIEVLLPRLSGVSIWATDADGRERRWTPPLVSAL
jgi:thiamine biosynthesis lipoprotein